MTLLTFVKWSTFLTATAVPAATSAPGLVGNRAKGSHVQLGRLRHTTKEMNSVRDLAECIPTGGSDADGNCKESGCCDVLVECGDDGTCFIPPSTCVESECEDEGRVCSVDDSCVGAQDVTVTPIVDADSPSVGVLTYDSEEIVLIGEKDADGAPISISEAIVYLTDRNVNVHLVLGSSGKVSEAFFDESDEIVTFEYDEDGVLVGASETSAGDGRRLTRVDPSHLVQARQVRRGLQADNDNCNALCVVLAVVEAIELGAACQVSLDECNSGFLPPAICNALFALCIFETVITVTQSAETCQESCSGRTCTSDSDCIPVIEICCPITDLCVDQGDAAACGDPHMTGFLGQKFDFTGNDGSWYALVSDQPALHVNMRVTSPVPSLPEITYITGLSIMTADAEGVSHSIVITVKDPHSLESTCPEGVSPCLAQGALSVLLDDEEALFAPGSVELGPMVEVSVVNLPGECRSFGFEKYWEKKKLEYAAQAAADGRRLGEAMDLGEWILGDPTATNMAECIEYVARASEQEGGLFAHESEHASFQIITPSATLRLSHGRLHQLPMRDPTDRFDLPDHLTWQMNVALDRTAISRQSTGVLGQTLVPTVDAAGKPIMVGMEAIRGTEEDYLVSGPTGVDFAQK